MAKGGRNQDRDREDKPRKNAGHGEAMGHRDGGGPRAHNDSAGRGSQDNSRREQGSSSNARR